MGESRLDLAMEFLTKAHKLGKKAKRDYVIQCVRHLTAWLAGDRELPTPNAVNSDDDWMSYCDLCFTRLPRDSPDLCPKCSGAQKVGSAPLLDEEQRRERERAEAERMQPEIDKHEEREKRWKR